VDKTLAVALSSIALLLAGTPGLAASNCKLMKVAEWRVSPTGPLTVEGAINGQQVNILLDSGAARSFVLRAAADRLGLTRQEALGYRFVGVGGETHVEQTLIDEFKIGQAVRKNWLVFVLGERDFGHAYSALLGYEFFEHVDVEFDLPHNAVRLFRIQDCAETPLAYWGGVVDVVKLDIDNTNPKIRVPVKLNGKSLVAVLDSGSGTSVVSRLVAAQLGITPDSPGTVAAGTAQGIGAARPDQWIGSFDSFSIGGEIVRNPQIRFTNLEVASAETGSRLMAREELSDMLLGIDFLRAHRVYVAHSQGQVYFAYTGGSVFSASRQPPTKPVAKPDR